ncbi:WEB family protein [Dorcoceras hygrometricum]|uniref:WEB family protein n=1 Tax=Dorcoceras hygrometricum TaxID=472368 RepID=A0A2Z7D567_9LAMI|nr:WEB family protein [Dorcoceras hygrometricum]
MASSFYSNTQHIDFASVLAMNDPGMVSMFQALVASGLEGFLGCTAVVYETALIDLFENASVRDGVIISTVAGQLVEISEEWFAEMFELPVDGLADVSEIPKDKIFDARSIVLSGEPVILSGLKSQMKIHYRLLCDIMVNVKMNWGRILFGILKKMVTSGTKQAKGFAIQISLLLANVPNLELGEASKFPSSKILIDKTVHRYIAVIDKSGAQDADVAPKATKAPKKRTAAVPADVPEDRVETWFDNVFAEELATAGHENQDEDTAAGDDSPAAKVDEEVPWFVRPFICADRDTERLFETASDSENVMDIEVKIQDLPVVRDIDVSTVGEQEITAFGEQLMGTNDESSEDIKAEEPVEKSADEFIDDDEARSLEDILLSIPLDIPLPSAGMEIPKFEMGKEIKIPEVNERTWFLNSLPKIPAWNKGKAILVEKDPMKGNPAQEHYFLICADIDFLVALRAKIIDEVAQFFNSFSLKKLETINIEEMYKKEEKVLSWGETESPQLAIQRKLYILLKYREVLVRKFLESWKSNFVPGQGSSAVDLRVIDLLSDLHLFILEELTKEARAHDLSWKKPCCSGVFEGEIRDRGAVIARSNTNTRSSCWIRTMLKVDGAWIVEPCADRWVKIPRQIFSCEFHRQRQYDDTLPSVSDFFRLLKKRWADVCLEVVAFCSSRRLLPVGSVTFCRGLPVGEPVFRVAPRHSPLPTADITDFLSSIALNRTAFRSAQISQNTVSVAPSVQLSLDQRQSSPTSVDSSSSLHFDTTDLDATASSLPSVSIDFSAALADFQVILFEQINESQSGISSRLHKIEHGLRDSLHEQAEAFKNLFQEARQEGRTIDDVQTLRFNEFRKNILAQNASIFTGLADVLKEVQEVNAKVDIMASRLNDVRQNVEETKEALSHQLLEFQSQAQENQNILHAQLSELVNYINRGSADKKGESSSRRPQQPPNVQIRDSGTGGDSAVRTPTFAQRVEMVQRQIVENVLDTDRNSESLERQAASERDRERRRREARLLKKRRRF